MAVNKAALDKQLNVDEKLEQEAQNILNNPKSTDNTADMNDIPLIENENIDYLVDENTNDEELFFNTVIKRLRANYSNSKKSMFRIGHKLTEDETAIICSYILHVINMRSEEIYNRLPLFTRMRTKLSFYYMRLSNYVSDLPVSDIGHLAVLIIHQHNYLCINHVIKMMILDKPVVEDKDIDILNDLIIDTFIKHFLTPEKRSPKTE